MCSLLFSVAGAFAASLAVKDVSVTDVCMNKRMVRLDGNGIFADNCGMGVVVAVDLSAEGLAGQRVLCVVQPLDDEGDELQDSEGTAMSVIAFNVAGNEENCTVTVPMPHAWVVREDTRNTRRVKFGVSAVAIGQEIGDERIFTLDESKMKIDNKNLPEKLMSDMMGVESGGSMGMAGALLGSLFDSSDASSEQECPSCEGSRICPHCDGDAYFNPSVCRKCTKDPGFCRRCKGEGTIVRKYDIY